MIMEMAIISFSGLNGLIATLSTECRKIIGSRFVATVEEL